MHHISPYQLGATIYMPATRSDLTRVVYQKKIPDLKSLVLCLEDSILEEEVEQGIENIQDLLMTPPESEENIPLIFIRPRNISVAKRLLKVQNIERITGFVLPKFDTDSFFSWLQIIQKSPKDFVYMPTLETADILDPDHCMELISQIKKSGIENRILVFRIGGNDLLSSLRLRRPTKGTLYNTPLQYIISMLVSIFTPAGFYLTAPVCESFGDEMILREEIHHDIQFGLVGKTAIHPTQIRIIQEAFMVDQSDYDAANLILAEDARGVFQHEGKMCEPSTHHNWAIEILQRARYSGVSEKSQESL